jgi:hypothetical protein
MKSLAIHATKNTQGKRDATGAFKPEAIEFEWFWAGYRHGFDNMQPKPARMKEVEDILGRYRDLELIAIFCHGYRRGLQTGHDMSTVGALARAIAFSSASHVNVVLYACSTAHEITIKRGGFADALRDELSKLGKTGHVDAHTTAKHAVWNPDVQRFDMGDPESEIIGDWIVAPERREPVPRSKPKILPADPEWKAWVRRLKADKDPFCYRFPTMTIQDIRSELRS